MEFNLKTVSAGRLVSALDSVSEQPVDIDFTLPDYCPDIEKILRCKLTPKIYNRSLSGGQLQLDGTSVVTVLYVSTDKSSLRVCEQSVPFSASFQVKDLPEDYVIDTTAKCEYINCRALSKRRLTVHGAFSLSAKIYCKGKIELFTPDESDDIQFNVQKTDVSELSALCGDVFSVSDEIYIKGKPPVELILDSEIKANITECKRIPDKIMLGGELSVKLLYLSGIENSTLQQVDCVIPFSQVSDCDGLTEDTEVCPEISVLSSDIRLKSDILSENPIVNVDTRLSLIVRGYSSKSVSVVTDAYSTKYRSELDVINEKIPMKTSVLSDSFMHKMSVSLGDSQINEIVDFRGEYCPLVPIMNTNSVNLNAKMNICVLGYNSDRELVYIERSVEISKTIELDDEYNSIDSLTSRALSLSYRMGDNNEIEIRCEIKYCLTVSDITAKSLVKSVRLNEDCPVQAKPTALILYYSDKGEKIWDIAKAYKTSVNRLIEENSIDSESLSEPTMLLIPTV